MAANLRDATPLVGRRKELEAIRRLLEGSRLVTLTGIGGAGKTRLARRTTADLSRALKDGAWIVELADVHQPALLGHTIATAVGLHVQSSDWQTSLLTTFFGERQILLTLDNCEHLASACSELVDEILYACPGVRVLATSQHALGLAAESIFQVPPLSLPDSETSPPLESLTQYESISLFVDRAAALMPGFELTTANADSVVALCKALDGIPLAIELAAARIRVLTPHAMVQRLGDRHRLLSRGFGGRVPDRQRSLEASVDWTYDLCTDQEQKLWEKLSIFRGGFGLDAAEEVGSAAGLEPADVLDVLASLVDKSVVVREDDGVRVRYKMLETLRQYGEARLSRGDGGAEEVRRRHRDYFLDLAERCEADWVGPRQVEWLTMFREEHANLRAALQYSVTTKSEASAALRLVCDLEGFWVATGMVSEARRWLDLALAHSSGTAEERAIALRVAAWFALVQVDIEGATIKVDQIRQLADESAEEIVQAQALLAQGLLAAWQDDPASGIDLIERSLDILGRGGDRPTQCFGFVVLGMLLGFTGYPERAAIAQRECLSITEPGGELYMRSFALAMLGVLALAGDDIETATVFERQSLSMKQQLSDQLGIALVLEFMAWIAVAEKRGERAAQLLGAAGGLWQSIGVVLGILPYFSVIRAANEQVASGLVPEAQFQAALNKGATMPVNDSIAFALEETQARDGAPQKRQKSPLTAREQEVAGLVSEGLTNQQIADRLVLSVRTAQAHVENILRKLGFSSRSSIAAWVAQHEPNVES